jgi:hypothetical protein
MSITVSSDDYPLFQAGRPSDQSAMEIMMEETFGPVVGIMKVEGDDEALQLMNDSPYGLVCPLLLHFDHRSFSRRQASGHLPMTRHLFRCSRTSLRS